MHPRRALLWATASAWLIAATGTGINTPTNSELSAYVHIPKAGGYSVFRHLADDAASLPTPRPTVGLCNHHGEPWVDVLSPRQNGAETCWLFASEAPYPEALTLTPPLEHLRWFSLVRSPQTHVLSMYFHCKESHDHRKYRGAMPGLGEWLERKSSPRPEAKFDLQHHVHLCLPQTQPLVVTSISDRVR